MSTTAIYPQKGIWYLGVVNTGRHWVFQPDKPATTTNSITEMEPTTGSVAGPIQAADQTPSAHGKIPRLQKLVPVDEKDRLTDSALFAAAPPPQSVQNFANAIGLGQQAIVEQLENPEIIDLADDDPAWTYNAAFEEAGTMVVEDTVVFEAAAEGVADLSADLATVGEAVLEGLGLLLFLAGVKGTFLSKDPKVRARTDALTKKLMAAYVPDFVITFNNYTGVDWSRTAYNVQNDVTDRVISTPDTTLQGANGKLGSETLSWYYFASSIGIGEANGNVSWQAPDGTAIGVNIHIPVQVYHIGTSPYYQIWDDTMNGWNTPVSDPSQKYSWNVGQYTIEVTPTAGGTTFTALVSMKPLGS